MKRMGEIPSLGSRLIGAFFDRLKYARHRASRRMGNPRVPEALRVFLRPRYICW
jgi:hypothetical protein